MSTTPTRRGWMLVVGVFVLVGGLVAAGALWYASGQRLDDNVAGFARAPSGCATTLDFDRTGEFVLHLETAGTLDELAGDCDAATAYDRDDAVDPELDLADPDGAAVPIGQVVGDSYDTAGFVGRQIATVVIETPGDHVLAVGADGEQFAIAVGHDARKGVAALRSSAIAAAIVALLGGGALLVLGSRQPPAPPEPTAVWLPDDQRLPTWPAAPPGFPAPPPTTGAPAPAGPPLVEPPPLPAPPAQPEPAPGVPRLPDGPPSSVPPSETPASPTWGPPSVDQ